MTPRPRSFAVLLATLALGVAGCGRKDPPATRTFTFHALSGISMGGIGSGLLAGYGDQHTKLDAVAPLGGPLDVAYFLGGFERMQIGGFCSYSQLSPLGDADYANGTDKLNDPTTLSCPESQPFMYEHQQDFNHWWFTHNGGTFDRSSYLQLFYDISIALGNPLYYNPDSPLFPGYSVPGHPGITQAVYNDPNFCSNPVVFSQENGNPIYNAEYNPDGKYPVITFCDGQAPIEYCNDANQTYVDFCQSSTLGVAPDDPNYPQAFCATVPGATGWATAGSNEDENWNLYYAKEGLYNPCYPVSTPVSFGLAVDYNRNGKRDYLEPAVINGHERFSDVGTDGCPDAQEDGKGGCTGGGTGPDPNHDNFDPVNNPLGTEGDWKWEKGEPFEDNGLDGVPNTHDYGEGNGKYDDGPNRENWFKYDFRSNYLGWSADDRARLDVYADGGLRDVFNFGMSADIMTSAVKAMRPTEFQRYLDFLDLPPVPGVSWASGFDATQLDFSKLTRNMFVRYGDVDATVSQIRNGDGDHVGTIAEAADRLETWSLWVSHVWEPLLGPPGRSNQQPLTYATPPPYCSQTLKALRNYAIALPPGYCGKLPAVPSSCFGTSTAGLTPLPPAQGCTPEQAAKRYPVVFLGHGYGMTPEAMIGFAVPITSLMSSGNILPMIFVFPSGLCCYVNQTTGQRDCRDENDPGVPFADPAWKQECNRGTFYVNRQGFKAGDNAPYGDSLFELFDYIDANYSTLPAKTVPLSEYP